MRNVSEIQLIPLRARAKGSGKHGAAQVCQICGDGVGMAAGGELFTACNVCRFPVCRPCYEYERKDGTQACPQCKTKYKRHKGKISQLLLPTPICVI